MGRGRAKAKQTKVARELKYREFNTDFNQLQRELHGDEGAPPSEEPGSGAESGDDDDPYADPYDDTNAESTPRR